MNRKAFLAAAPSAGVLAFGTAGTPLSKENKTIRDYYELRLYHYETEGQRYGIEVFYRDTAIPALNRIGINPVGIFQPEDGTQTVYVLLRYRSLETFAAVKERLLDDSVYCRDGSSFLEAPPSTPPYSRIESSLMAAFTGMPHIETPATSNDRVFQLRRYESPSIRTGQKKIEMFNKAEIGIFRKTGLNPVFFGQTLAGSSMPNLTYMLGFENTQEQKAAWERFRADPDWKALSAIPEYADKKILCGITNIVMKPLNCSQI